MTTEAPLALLSALVLEDGSLWGEVAQPFQWEDAEAIISDDGPRFHFLTRGRGSSKTTDLAGVALVWVATMADAGARGYVIASDKDQAALLTDAAAGLVSRTPELRGTVEVNAYKIAGPNGATVEVLAADGGSMFGLRGSFYICDEICQWGETRNVRRVWSAIVSALGKVKGCRFVCLSSAGEPSHWSHKVITDARKSDAWRVHEVPGPAPWMSAEVLAAQRPMLRDSEWSRLILNIWTQSEDRLVNAEDLEAAAVLDGPLEPRAGVQYVVTLDVGLTNDACVACVAHAELCSDEHGAPKRVVVDRLASWQGSRKKPVDLTEVEAWIAEASRHYNNAAVHADPFQAVGLLQRLRQRGARAEQFNFTSTSVGRVGGALHLALRNRLLWIPRDEDLLSELARVRLRETQPGTVRLDHDSGEHDDRAVAIGIAVAVLLGNITTSAAREWLESLSPIHTCGMPNPREALVCAKCQEPLTPPEPEPEYVPQHVAATPERWSPWSPMGPEVPPSRGQEALLGFIREQQGGPDWKNWAFSRRRS